MKKIVLFLALAPFLFPSVVLAHPGRTDSSGCHTCRTNCGSWGLSYGEYHCHNGGYSAPAYVAPVTTVKPSTPNPTVKATVKPTTIPTVKPSETLTPTSTIQPSSTVKPEVQGTSISSGGSVLGGLVGMAIFLFAGYKGLKWFARKTAAKDPQA